MRKRMFLGALAVCAVAGVCVQTKAVIVLNNGDQANLGTLLASGSDRKFQIGDKLFTLESFTNSQANDNASLFTVIAYVQGAGAGPLPNIGFDFVGPFGDGTPGDAIVHEINLQYTVEINPANLTQNPALRIKDTTLTFNGSATGTGSFARVDESVFTFPGGILIGGAPISVYNIFGPPASTLFQTPLDFSPGFTKIEVNKDIKTFAATAGNTATISQIRQEFSQIPTPGVIATLGLGVLAIGRRRR